MTDIPADVMEQAKLALKDMAVAFEGGGGYDVLKDRIARAIMAERERCAKIVDDECERILSKQDGKDPAVDAQIRMIAVLLPGIAASIRGDQP